MLFYFTNELDLRFVYIIFSIKSKLDSKHIASIHNQINKTYYQLYRNTTQYQQ